MSLVEVSPKLRFVWACLNVLNASFVSAHSQMQHAELSKPAAIQHRGESVPTGITVEDSKYGVAVEWRSRLVSSLLLNSC